jgi:flavin reductase (DIM6/NTAB) family NADH-FMN oxidoreductase RutF
MILDLNNISPADAQSYLLHAIAPRPICFASTIDSAGNINLSPFSFFNVFSTVPPVVIFSPARRMKDNTTKHTLENLLEIPEVVINIVDYDMVQQTSLSSCDFAKEVNEFVKAGFTAEPASLLRPPMVKESKVKMECRVLEIKALGQQGGAGNLVICEVLRIHIDESILDENKKIDQQKLHQVARLGGDWYCRVDAGSLFTIEKPNTQIGMGVDALPEHIRNSTILTGNHLGQLANTPEMPVVDPSFNDDRLKNIFHYYSINPEEMEKELHRYAKELVNEGKVAQAWQVLLNLN